MPKHSPSDLKLEALRQQGTLNPRPQDVTDDLFETSEFFDARDVVQVKYEMLRRVEKEGRPITEAAAVFGFSRPSFYQAQAAFEQDGLAGLVPRKRGPKEATSRASKNSLVSNESSVTSCGRGLSVPC